MKSTDLQKKKDAELRKMLVEKKEALRELSFGSAGSAKGDSPRNIRKDIARILTEVTARSKTDKK